MSNILPFPVQQEIVIDNYRIILLDQDSIPESSSYKNRNVLCLDRNQNIIWQIEELQTYPGLRKICPYGEIHYINNELILLNWCDLRLVVDFKTGKILDKKEVR